MRQKRLSRLRYHIATLLTQSDEHSLFAAVKDTICADFSAPYHL
jgi:hypothetical protein